ncbi:NAD(P)H-binding protein [Campylobacter sp. MIT 21-1685]|uniref:SDR family oxidoreductase n=1 Tax=unclassified Campylobacter TaxID=2593542 RepID=UPI00224B1B15|nr:MULTISPECIES: NAD(P)H-binding protein [unclassified Campylobacter]MCX2682617.1 NAD(P)H-binding protein [Campylobacter sp. MIT 21-1684]MCX2750897.1 NAD(P)H-binding protein [Campylobacter sp. MIT 21-1682]MCX2807170.1 NAD(P)H-binding protein [Campylobacter sp. MIT 21-1685]
MKIAVLAANGKSGRSVTNEALEQGLETTAFIRNKAEFDSRVRVIVKDIFALEREDLRDFDVIVDCFGEWQDLSLHLKHIQHLCDILQDNKALFMVVGGAGSLYMNKEHTLQLMHTPNFPKEYLGVAKAAAEVLDFLRTNDVINWLYISPAAIFYEGKRTLDYKLIGEEFQTNAQGESKISYQNYANAVIRVAKEGKYKRQRISLIEC